MANLQSRVTKEVVNAAGSIGVLKMSVTSSDILTTATQLTSAANKDILIEKVILSTDSTGLAGGTNFAIQVNGETVGLNQPIIETVANLGASAHRVAPHPAAEADTDTTDHGITEVAAVPFLLEAGDYLEHICTGSACTGSGVLRITIIYRRLAEDAGISSAV